MSWTTMTPECVMFYIHHLSASIKRVHLPCPSPNLEHHACTCNQRGTLQKLNNQSLAENACSIQKAAMAVQESYALRQDLVAIRS